MKKALVLFCLLFAVMLTNAQEQNRPTGLLGATFGDSVGKVKSLIYGKDGFSFVEKASNSNMLTFTGPFGGEKELIITFRFFDDQLFEVQVVYPYENNTMMRKYQTLKEMVVEKYGDPVKDVLEVPEYYQDDPEYGIENNRAAVGCSWAFKNDNDIILYCTKDAIRLFYLNELLNEKNSAREEANNLKDF